MSPEGRGRIERALIGLFARTAEVVEVEAFSEHFRLINLAGDALKDVDWTPGLKLQVMLGGATWRTYTPIDWPASEGTTRILAWSHGDGPGSRWASGLVVGDRCQFFGPRRSLELDGLGDRVVLFGDETSFGLGAAMTATSMGGPRPESLFEVTSVTEARPVLEAIGLGDAALVERNADDAHLAELEIRAVARAKEGASFVLTGKAGSIQRVSRALKAAGVTTSRIRTKAYWAPGKTGMD